MMKNELLTSIKLLTGGDILWASFQLARLSVQTLPIQTREALNARNYRP